MAQPPHPPSAPSPPRGGREGRRNSALGSFGALPSALSPAQWRVVWIATLLLAALRIWARSATAWDWDEAQFSTALRDYDVAEHHPHPPGYPLFVAAAKLLTLLGAGEFSALQTVTVVAAMLLFPAAFLFARELGFRFGIALGGAVLYALLPNVLFYGGTAFSDVPASTVTLFACALLLRGRHDRRAYVAGAVLLGIATGIRTTSLFVGAVPGMIATWTRLRNAVRSRPDRARELAAIAIAGIAGATIVAGSYIGAALATGSFESYRWALDVQSEWVRNVDSFRSPTRPDLLEVAKVFFVLPVQDKQLMFPFAGLAALGAVTALLRRRRAALLTTAVFLPVALFSWLMLDVNCVGRYAIAYLLLHAMLAAEGAAWIAGLTKRAAPVVLAVLIASFGGAFVWWSLPSLQELRERPSPPAEAIDWMLEQAGEDGRFYVFGSLRPWAAYALSGRSHVVFSEASQLQLSAAGSGEWLLTDGASNCEAAKVFRRDRGRLWAIARPRYFEISVVPRSCLADHRDGWYIEEGNAETSWRWMGARSETRLSPVAGPTRLMLAMEVPSELLSPPPTITVSLNGAVVDRFSPVGATFERAWTVTPRADGWNDLVIETSRFINPARQGIGDDGRDLGLLLKKYGWGGEKSEE
ncbi:MAG: hypothetical protein WA208_08880 [Thermoanaerobaculia bacterium]